MHIWYIYLVIAYLIGSLSSAIIISKLFKIKDPREYGSKNPGATNMLRGGNKRAAALTLIGDMLKGLIVVLAVKFLPISSPMFGHDSLVAWCGVLVVLGHIYPLFFGFKGGKGVATGAGVLFGFSIYLGLLALFTWLIVFKLSKISSVSAIISILLTPLYAYLLFGNDVYFGSCVIIAFFIIYKHKSNINRLVRKQEFTV